MDLESNGSFGCIDWMYAKDGRRSVTLCGKRWNEPLVMSSNELLVQLNTNSISNHKGFWLYFEGTFNYDMFRFNKNFIFEINVLIL